MLKEICITPQVFEESQLINESLRWKEIKNLLEAISLGGYIVGLNNSDWKKNVRININAMNNQKIKDLLNTLISILDKRQRIAGHPKSNISPNSEQDWVEIAQSLDNLYPFHSMLATKSYSDKITSIDELEFMNIGEAFGNTGSKHSIQSENELENIFVPLLSYAKKVTIIDPYFDIETPRYKTTLKLIAKCFKNRRGIQEGGTIYINCSYDKLNAKEHWREVINDIYKQYGHIIVINMWEKQQDGIKMHDRYIITDQSGVVSAAGIDKNDYQQSEWGMKDYNTLDTILKQYKENSSPFKLKTIVTATQIEYK